MCRMLCAGHGPAKVLCCRLRSGGCPSPEAQGRHLFLSSTAHSYVSRLTVGRLHSDFRLTPPTAGLSTFQPPSDPLCNWHIIHGRWASPACHPQRDRYCEFAGPSHEPSDATFFISVRVFHHPWALLNRDLMDASSSPCECSGVAFLFSFTSGAPFPSSLGFACRSTAT